MVIPAVVFMASSLRRNPFIFCKNSIVPHAAQSCKPNLNNFLCLFEFSIGSCVYPPANLRFGKADIISTVQECDARKAS